LRLGIVLALAISAPAAAGAGDLDRSFSGDGRVVRDLSQRNKVDLANAVATRGKRTFVVGQAKRVPRGSYARPVLTVACFRPDGRLDPSFAGDGVKYLALTGPDSFGSDVEIDSRGRVVIAANAGISDEFNEAFSWRGAVVRLRPDGALDRSFAGNGQRSINRDGPVLIRDLAVAPNDGIAVAGRYDEPDDGSPLSYPSDFAAALIRPRGAFDRTFSGDGWQTTDLGFADDEAEGIAFSSGGSLVVAGRAAGQVALVRYLANGQPDPGFSEDGIQRTSVGDFSLANDIAVDRSGRILVVGETEAEDDVDFLAARYTADGTLDDQFSDDGVRSDDIGDFDVFSALALDPNGKLVAVGTADRPSRNDGTFALARYRPNGALDRRFGREGIQLTDFGKRQSDVAEDVEIDRRGRLVAVGSTLTPRRSYDLAMARYRAGR
jgi:uncharacterized delta-60 repeat protein